MPVQTTARIYLKQYALICEGKWDLANLTNLEQTFAAITWPASGEITVNGKAIAKMDSAGAWLFCKFLKKMTVKGLTIQLENFSVQLTQLISLIEKRNIKPEDIPQKKIPDWLTRLGKLALNQLTDFYTYLVFVGKLSTEVIRVVRRPKHLRFASLANGINRTGYQALPIIGLLSVMIGVVLAYQMGIQLRNYGANVFIVDLLGLSILREFGPLLTAIIVAGRTGSAYTAELGLMKVNQELDALNTMGVTPEELLLLPRILALVITLPLLTMWADIFGVLGGMAMANNMLNISLHDFLHRFEHEIPLRALLIGLGKTPVFALIIASIGCFQGVSVQDNAESIGKNTTKSVVLAIFFIIVADAIFSVIFSKLHL